MNENIFWIWDGWGLLFTGIIALSQFLYMLLPPTSRRTLLIGVDLTAIVLSFIFSGWIVGLLAFPVGVVAGGISGLISANFLAKERCAPIISGLVKLLVAFFIYITFHNIIAEILFTLMALWGGFDLYFGFMASDKEITTVTNANPPETTHKIFDKYYRKFTGKDMPGGH